ncbi:integral membrane protein, partial [Patellaria atrata CBS 101060]
MPGGLHPPAEVVTSWPKLNAIDPERKNWSLVIHTIVLFTITLFVVCARFWARCKVQRNAGLDDALIAVAMVPLLGLAISTCLSSRYYGFDRHIWDLTVSQASESRRAVMAMEVFYILTTGPIKISILCFYRRLSTGTISTKFIWTVWLSIASVIGYMVAFMIALFATCRPIDAYWNFMDPAWTSKHEYTCADEAAILFSAVIISMIQDIITCVLPIWFVWNLQLAKRQKIAVAGIFLVGFLTCIAGALRMYYIHRVYYETYDITWAAEEGWLWTMIESHLGIICASAPALKIFF